MNRIGDCGLLFAIVFIIMQFGCVDFQTLFSELMFKLSDSVICSDNNLTLIELTCFCLFVGVMAKSAQIGLHT